MATCLVKLYCFLVLDNIVRLRPSVSLHIFIHDSDQWAHGPPEKVLKETVIAGNTFAREAPTNLWVAFAV